MTAKLTINYDFKEYSASAGRHSIHQYPAMLHYKMVEALLQEFGGDIVYDPFCGSGVTIVEALKQKRAVVGTDINPLALLISDVRASNFNKEQLDKYYKSLQTHKTKDIPEVKNLDYWFKPKNIEELGKIRSFIRQIEDEHIKKFFLAVFSQTVRNVSLNKNGEFKRYRIKNIEEFEKDAFEEFDRLYRQFSQELYDLPMQLFKVWKQDVRDPIPLSNVDTIITSPPYGDSRTTVAYGQFSSFSLDWLKGLNPYGDDDLKLDSKMLGGKKRDFEDLPSQSLNDVLHKIKEQDEKRAKEVFGFFYDLFLAIEQIAKTLSRSATVCFVVGNRTVKGIQIPMDVISKEFFEYFGMSHYETRIRAISNKRMPAKNSPTNKAGKTSSTMMNEYIVIMKKAP